jgi:tetratricopeptide (TPR) repeat protein
VTLDEVLNSLAHIRDPRELSRLDRRRLEVLSRGDLDARQRERLRRLAPDLAEGRALWVPGVGESFVLTASAAGGEVVRLRVERKGEPYTLETPGLEADAARQVHFVYQALRRLAAARRRGVPELGARGHVVTCSRSVDGASLGVSAAVAFVSSWLGRPPSAGVAATAAIDGEGGLREVAHVEEKHEALVRERPGVTLLLAAKQSVDGVNVLRCAHLDDALRSFDLDLDSLAPRASTGAQREDELRALARAQNEDYSAERWLDFVTRALALAEDLDCEPDRRTMALGNAMLFALHAGDVDQAEALGAKITDGELEHLGDAERAWVYVVRATAAIDKQPPERAIQLAELAAEAAHRLQALRERRDVCGRAFGTLGRALMHASRDEEARTWLEKGVHHHRQHLREELPRSLCYLAANLRRLGRHEDAAHALEEAFTETHTRHDAASASSALFLLYERARLRFERGEFEACLEDIESIKRRQSGPTHYPRLGTLRYEVACRAALGDRTRAEQLRAEAATFVDRLQGPLRRMAEAVAVVDLDEPEASRGRWEPGGLVY